MNPKAEAFIVVIEPYIRHNLGRVFIGCLPFEWIQLARQALAEAASMDELLSSDATMSGAWLVTFVARITISKSHQPRSFQRCRHLEILPTASPLDKQPFCASNPRFPGFQPKVAETRFRELGEGVSSGLPGRRTCRTTVL